MRDNLYLNLLNKKRVWDAYKQSEAERYSLYPRLTNGDKKMKKVIYFCQEGKSVGDFDIDKEVDWIVRLNELNYLDEYYIENFTNWYTFQVFYDDSLDIPKSYGDLIKSNNIYLFYSTHLIIDELRARIAENVINNEDYEFWIEDLDGIYKKKTIDDYGRSNDWYESENILDNIFKRLFDI